MSAVLYDVAGPKARRRIQVFTIVGSLVLLGLLALAAVQLAANDQFDADKYEPFVGEDASTLWPNIFEALALGTLRAAAYALVLALALGMVLAFGRLSTRAWIRVPAVAVIEFFRGVPLLLLIFFFFLGFPLALGITLPALWALVLGLTLYNGAVIAEILRAGILSLPRGQTEAALAIGLTRGQTLRLVLLPQAIRIMLPALISQLIVLLKDTSLGFVVGYVDLLRYGQRAAILLDNPIQLFTVVALIYIAVNFALSRLAIYVESRQRARLGEAAVPEAEEAKEEVGRQG